MRSSEFKGVNWGQVNNGHSVPAAKPKSSAWALLGPKSPPNNYCDNSVIYRVRDVHLFIT